MDVDATHPRPDGRNRQEDPSFGAVEYAVIAWVDWFNNRRLLERTGDISPAEAEARYYTSLDATPMAK